MTLVLKTVPVFQENRPNKTITRTGNIFHAPLSLPPQDTGFNIVPVKVTMSLAHDTQASYAGVIGRDSYEMSNHNGQMHTVTSSLHSLVPVHDNTDDDSEDDASANEDGNEDTKRTTAWKIHWMTPSLMFGYLVLGIAFALCHHFYWQSLDGQLVTSQAEQEWAQRFGLVLAFMAQSTFTLAVGVAFVQRTWLTVKDKPMKLGSLDKAFSLRSDISAFFSWEMLSKAKLLCLIGICAW